MTSVEDLFPALALRTFWLDHKLLGALLSSESCRNEELNYFALCNITHSRDETSFEAADQS